MFLTNIHQEKGMYHKVYLVHMAKSFSGPDDGSQAIMIIEAQRQQHFSQP